MANKDQDKLDEVPLIAVSDDKETPCPKSHDGLHCVHWYDDDDGYDEPQAQHGGM